MASKRPQKKRSSAKRVVAKRARGNAPNPITRSDPATSIEQRILAAIRRIPRGRVSTYGDIANVAGLPRRARLVGTVLRQTPAKRGLPWFRVINSAGRSSLPDGSDAHRRQCTLLQAEGVELRNGRVDLNRYGWPPRERQLDELLWRVD